MDIDKLYKQFGQRLKRFRRAAKLTQAQVAEQVGLTRTSITNIEHGRQHVMLHQLILLASAVSVSPAQLLSDQETTLEELVPSRTLATLRKNNPEEDLAVLTQALNSSQADRQTPEMANR
jgi:transcriptional regulator with XRE-family HTH domain